MKYKCLSMLNVAKMVAVVAVSKYSCGRDPYSFLHYGKNGNEYVLQQKNSTI